jgi:uncharacterized tellurite resistance protein B-like protein
MIKTIKAFFEKYLAADTATDSNLEHRLQLASAALLVEVTFADGDVSDIEETELHALLKSHFALSHEETDDLLELAHAKKHEATDYFQFTSLLNKHYTQQQKIQLIEYLWRLAYADNSLDKFEEHLIRRLADLLHVPHADFIQSKLRAAE